MRGRCRATDPGDSEQWYGRAGSGAPAPVTRGRPSRAGRTAAAGAVVLALLASTAACGAGSQAGRGGGGSGAPSITAPSGSASGPSGSASGPSNSGPSGSGPSASSPSASGSAPATTHPSAADQLTRFFAAAAQADRQLRAAAVLINRGIGSERIIIDPATVKAIQAVDARALIRTIPGGLPPRLLKSVLLVYEDLASRRLAMDRVVELQGESPLSRSKVDWPDFLACLRNGTAPARWFPGDLATARRIAAATPRLNLPPERSRLTAEAAVYATYIWLGNAGCGSCGGYLPRNLELPKIIWRPINTPDSTWVWDGRMGPDGLMFQARYSTGTGWRITLAAC